MSTKQPSNGMEVGSNQTLDFNNVSSTLELTSKRQKNGDAEKSEAFDVHGISFEKINPTTELDALIHVVKSSLGTGVLATPNGFKNAGFLIGTIGTVVIGMLCTHATYIMVKSSQQMCALLNKPFLGYADTIKMTMIHCASKRFSQYAEAVKKTVEFFMFFTYFGVNTAYVLLIAETLREVIEAHVDITWNIRIYILIAAIPVLLFGVIGSMKYLVPFSMLANALLVASFGLIMYYVFSELPDIKERKVVAPVGQWPLFISTVLFGLEGIGTVLPIENSMKRPQNFLGCPGVLTTGMSMVVFLFVFIGFFGYWRYGDSTAGSVSLNLNQDTLAEVVKIMVATAILFTYGLQLTASSDVAWKRVQKKYKGPNEDKAYYIVRILMILATITAALVVPNLAPVISLIGAVGFSMCGFFFPAITDTVRLWDEGFGPFKWILWKNLILMLVALIALFTGSVVSMSEIIDQYA